MTRTSRDKRNVVAPGEWLGLLGGGQLGRMFCMAAQSLGYKVAVLDPGADSPAGGVADRHIHADYLDPAALTALARLCRAATTEFENVPAPALEVLARDARVAPSASSVAIAQDRISEKTFLSGHGFGVAPFAVLRSVDDANNAAEDLLPGIVKSARFGYDGKGQIRVATRDQAADAFVAMRGTPCVLERVVSLACEVSVIVARNEHKEATAWPVAENHHRNGILDVTIAPARVSNALAGSARELALNVAAALDYRGVLCVEMFVTASDELLVNEIAPRPHNSGHYTIDACMTSQFEQQARVLADLPLGDPHQHTPAVMVNLLGDIWFRDGMSAEGPPQGANDAPSGGSDAAKPRAWGSNRAEGPPQGANGAPSGGSDAAKPRAWGSNRAERPPQGANDAPSGGSDAAKPRAWGSNRAEGPPQGANDASSGGSDAAKPRAWGSNTPAAPDWSAILQHPRAKLHVYGKSAPRRGRKMAHVTCLGATLDDALATARAVKEALGIPGADAL